MKVIATIQSKLTPLDGSEPSPPPPVDVVWYTGDSMSAAMAAVANGMASADSDDRYTKTLAIRVEF